ncbi:MAG: hypothetical protein ACR2PO_13925 [Methyloligellaceae bacterium]
MLRIGTLAVLPLLAVVHSSPASAAAVVDPTKSAAGLSSEQLVIAQSNDGKIEPVKGTVKGAGKAGKGVVEGTGEVGTGVVKGVGTVGKGVTEGPVGAGKGVIKGTGQVGVGVVKGAGKVGKGAAKGAGCVLTLGKRC